MGKFRSLSAKDVCSILSKHGLIEIRRRVSHIVMQKQIQSGTVTVIIPNHDEIRIGTLHSIIRQSRLTKSEFEY